ncbi:C40 family peptidase [Olivibacter ginsenosidimutans]|uniref:C40 family peptidase n=1 Tax=Olivibacter ginsenosidimutans TaxID=1176537 RepID=A0ABP9BBQ2_9SPHI
MKKILVHFLSVFAFHSFAFSQIDSSSYKKVMLLAESIKDSYHMDKRTSVFDLSMDSLGSYILEYTNKEAAHDFVIQYKKEGISAPLQICGLPDESLGDKVYGLVTVSVGNIRSQPRNSAEMVTQALLGWPVDLLKQQKGYYLVRTPDGYISWLDAAAVSLKSRAEIREWGQGKRIIFTDDYGHAYEAPDRSAMRVSDLVMGNILNVLEKGQLFSKVVFPDGRVAYVSNEQTEDYDQWKSNTHLTAENLFVIAKRMIGVPYLWGGTSIKGVDCSGFTKTAYLMNGVVIPRDASQQVLVGEPIEILTNNKLDTAKALKNLQAGDLLFFAAGKHKSPQARVTHVALYMGNGQFIQSAGKVRINSMLPSAPNYDDFQTRTVVAARRYLGHIGEIGLKKVE